MTAAQLGTAGVRGRLRGLRRGRLFGLSPGQTVGLGGPRPVALGRGRLVALGAGERRPHWPARAAALLAGAATAGLVGGWLGPAAGVTVAGALWWLAGRGATGRRGELRGAAADLPIAVDLLAAALRAGAPPARAAEVVGDALGGALGRRLARVGTALRLGTRPEEAWAPLAGIPGADRVRRAAVRSADSGAAMTGALGRVADDLRAARAADAEAGAQRLGVLVVLPLGLCFLPAFLLTGVVPVVVAVLGDVLRSS